MFGWNRKQIIKYFLLLFFTVSIYMPLFSQERDTISTESQGTRKSLNVSDLQDLTKDGFNFWQDKFDGHFAGIDIGLNTFLNSDYSGYSPELVNFMDNDLLRSNSMFINVLHQSIGLQYNRNTIGLVTGLGIQFQSYRLDKNTTIDKMPNGIIVPETLVFEDNQKSKLSLVYLIAPFLIEFQKPIKNYKNRVYFSTGIYGGLRVSSHTKIKYRVDRKKEKLKTPDDFSLNDFKFGFMVRTGYRWVNVFGTYDATSFFKKSLGPELTPITVGVTLLRF